MPETCDPIGNCRGTLLCPCGCGSCVVHCPGDGTWVDADGVRRGPWIKDTLAMLESLDARRERWLAEQPEPEPVDPEEARRAEIVARLTAKAEASRRNALKTVENPGSRTIRIDWTRFRPTG